MEEQTRAPQGGADWESGAAADAVTQAAEAWARDPSDSNTAAWNKAIRDMNAAVGSRSMQTFSAVAAPIMASLKRLEDGQEDARALATAARDDAQATRQEVATVARQYVELREWWETRYTYMLGQIEGFIARADRQLTVYGEQIDNLSRRMDASERDRADLRRIIERLPASEQLAVIKDVQRQLRRMEIRQWLQFIPIALVVSMLFAWAVITLARSF